MNNAWLGCDAVQTLARLKHRMKKITAVSTAAGQAMNRIITSPLVQRINAQNQQFLYLHILSGVHYLAVYESACTYELNPIHGQSIQVNASDLTNAEVWQKLH